ncbi:MAG: T9SS type A sorting domain-containing protein, partial [bacterium]|nr:T9SS type A sorting domain-containing protein [bacterium]
GAIPTEFANLVQLKNFYINDNQLTDLPDLSPATSLVELWIQNNKFTFEDIEPNLFVASFIYSPQDSVGARQDTTIDHGASLTISVTVGGTANQYQWMKNDVAIPGANSNSYTIDSAASADQGSYVCKITNTLATALTLYSRPIYVTVTGAVLLPDNWNFTANTGNSATIVLPTTANPNIDGIPLQNDDYIGVFTPAGLCCGWKQWQGANISITAWGDNDQTSAIDGFQSGENINYRVYRISEAQEWDIVQVGYSQGSGNYASNAFMVLNQFDVMTQRSITLNFAAGWNMFSINVLPDDPNIASVMSPVVSKLVLVKNGAGQTYIPAYGINDINDMTYDAGYQAYFTEAMPLDVSGAPLAADTPINLSAGWSLISYLPTVPIDVATALATVSSQLIIAKNNQGQTYVPAYGINDIGAMLQGQGYFLYLQTAGTLVYPTGFVPNDTTISSPPLEHFSFIAYTGENATLVIPADINPGYSDGRPLEPGDEIGVFTSDGLCCSAINWEGVNKALTVWGNNSQTSQLDGFAAGDTFRIRVWHKASNTEFAATINFQTDHPPVYQANGFSVLTKLIADLSTVAVKKSATDIIPTTFQLMQNYPNPFNPETTIEYGVREACQVLLEIFDIAGRQVATLVNSFQQPGVYKVNFNAGNLATGVYFYRIRMKAPSLAPRSRRTGRDRQDRVLWQ